MKKIISVILAVLICVCLSLSAFAAGEPTFEVSSVSAKAGDTVNVKINIKNNPGIASAKLEVSFDGQLKLEKIDYGKKLGGSTMKPEKLISPVTLNWVSPTSELKGDAEYATLTFTVLKDAKDGAHKINISYNPDDVYNFAEKNIKFKAVAGVITVSGGTKAPSGNSESGSSDTVTTGDNAGAASSSVSNTATVEKTSSDASKNKTSDTAGTLTSDSTITTGENINEGKGDYTGEEEILEFVDEKGNPVDGVTSEPKSQNKVIWIVVIVVSVLILGAVAFLIIKKFAAKPKE